MVKKIKKGGGNMPITDKVKAAMAVSGKENKDLALYLGVTTQSLSNKFSRGSFSAEDLIKIADFTGAVLNLEFEDKTKITLCNEDIRE